jgi:translocation and assembly module TamB
MRIRRRWKIALAVVLTGMVALAVAMVSLLNSPIAARQAARILGSKLGARVEIDAVSVGLSGTTVTGVRVFEPGALPDAIPLLKVASIEADTSLGSLATGAVMPHSVVIRDPALRLRFAADGRLATRFPHATGGGGGGGAVALPAVRVEGASAHILQDGKPEAVLSGIDLHLSGGAGAHTLTGSIVDPAWGKWKIRGAADPSFASGSVDVRGLMPIAVSTDRLARLPLVDPAMIRDYPFEVRVVAGVGLVLKPGAGGLSYRAEARVVDGTATVTAAQLAVARLSGVVTVADAVVTFRGLSAAAADGTITGDGRVDLTGDVIRVDLGVTAERLDVTQVPPSWGLEEVVESGRFSGQARLLIERPPGGPIRTGGEGRCVVTDARLLGAAAEGPVELTLRPTGGGFRFGTGSGTAQASEPDSPSGSWIAFLAKKAVKLLLEHVAEKDARTGRVKLRLALRDLDLAKATRRLPVKLPFVVAGRVSVRVEVDLPTDTPDDLAAYRIDGSAEAPTLSLEGVTFRHLKVRVAFRDGTLSLDELSGLVSDPAGETRFAGSARLGIVPAGDLTARLSVEGLPLGMLARLVPGADLGLGGAVSGTAELAIPAAKLTDVTAWEASAAFRSSAAAAFGWTLQGFDAGLTLRAGTAALSRLRGTLEGAAVQGEASVRLADDYPFQARLALTGFELAAANRLAPMVRPPVRLEGKLTTGTALAGRLLTRQFRLTGAAELTAARVETVPIERLAFRWDIDRDRVRVTDFGLVVAGGMLSGTVEVPLRGTTPGAASFTLRQMDVKRIIGCIPALRSIPTDGRVDGAFAARIPVDRRDLVASASLTSGRVRVRGITAERVNVSARVRPGGVDYRLTGQALGGTVALGGSLPLGAPVRLVAATDPPPGQLRVEGIRLERLVEALGLVRPPAPVAGIARLSMDYRHDPADGRPLGGGRFRLEQVRWGGRELIPEAQADVTLTRDQLRISDVSAALLQGRFRANGMVNLVDPDRSWADAWLDQVPAAAVLRPLGVPADRVDARVTLSARSLLGRQIRGGAVLMVPRAKIDGLIVTNARTSVEWNVLPTAGRGELIVRQFSGQLAGGRVNGKASYLMATDGTRLRGSGQFTHVEIGTIAKTADALATVGIGRATGVMEFDGRDVRSVKELTGTVRATLGPSQALRLPVLKDIVPFLGPGRSVTTSFKQSEVRARLVRGGLVRVERLALAGPKLSVFAEGVVALPDRLHLDVVATTGDLSVDTSLLEKLGMNIPAMVGPVPVGLIIRASKYLSDRTVHLDVTGTARSPQIRINPLQILSEEAIRFFLGGTPINPFEQ